jgi:hypothetical protein
MLSAKQFTNGSNLNINPITLRPGIDGWDINTVSNVSMQSMFQSAIVFNREVSSWNVSKVTTFASMFSEASIFNNGDNLNTNPITGLQGINGWNINTVSGVSMSNMFAGASAFNRYISGWNISNVTNFTNFMLGKTPSTYSSTNLDAIYNGWIVNGVKPNISISFGTAKYTAAGTSGRNTLTSAPNNWIIIDGGTDDPTLNLDAGNPLSYPGTGTLWTDLSGNNNNGTLINGPTFDSANGGSIVFDGTNDYVNLYDPSSLRLGTSNFTISLWFLTSNNNSDGTLLAKRQFVSPFNFISLGIGTFISDGIGGSNTTPSKKIRFGIRINATNQYLANTTNDIIDGQWKNIVLIRNSGTILLYVNNIIQSTNIIYNLGTGISSDISVTGYNWSLGALGDVSTLFLNGNIAQSLIYNRALSSTEVLQNYNATKGRYGL